MARFFAFPAWGADVCVWSLGNESGEWVMLKMRPLKSSLKGSQTQENETVHIFFIFCDEPYLITFSRIDDGTFFFIFLFFFKKLLPSTGKAWLRKLDMSSGKEIWS